jgi:type I restriction enzyme S subunit
MSDELPEGWASARIADVFEVNPRRPAADHVSEGTPVSFVPMGAVDANRGAITEPGERPFGAVRRGYTAFADGDVLLAKITPCFENGKAAVASSLRNGLGFGSSEFHVFRPQGAVLAPYLFHFLRQPQLRADAAEFMTGTAGQARVPIDHLSEMELPVAPLAEQRRIVAKVEALLEQVRRAKDRLDRLPLILQRFRQSVLAAACSGQLTEAWRVANPDRQAPARPAANRVARTRRQGANISKDGELLVDEMPDLPDSWAYWRADEVVASDTVVTYGIVLPGPEHPGGVPYVRQQDIVDGGILVNELRHTTPAIAAKHARSTLRAGDVLLCIIRNLRVAIVPKGLDGANLTQGTVRLRPGQHVRGDYLAAYLACPAAQAWMKARYFGMDMPRINVEDARAIPIALPPIDEQAEIMGRVDALLRLEEMVRGRLAVAINRAGALPQAILSKGFAGELVSTEAEIASAEGRDYETAERMLARVRDEHVEDEVGLRLRQQSTGDKQTRRKRVRS